MSSTAHHYLLCPFGSGGDVFPFVGIGKGLRARGHRVTVISLETFEKAIREAGLEFASVGTKDDFERIANDPRLWHPIHGPRAVFRMGAEAVRVFYDKLRSLISDPQHCTILAPATVFGARLAREKLGVRLLTVHLQPAVLLSLHDTPVFFAGAPWLSRLPIGVKRFLFSLPNPINQMVSPVLRRECLAEGVTAPRHAYPDWWESPDGTIVLFPGWFASPQPDWPTPCHQHTFPREDLAEGAGVLAEPSITVSPWFEARRQRYYDALLGVSTSGDWSTWVEFFAEGLTASAAMARKRMLQLTQVQDELKERVQTSRLRTANARLLVDLAVASPTFTVRQAAEHLGLQRPGAKKLVDALVDLGILAQFGERAYGRRFHAPRVIEVLLSGSQTDPSDPLR